MTDLTIRSTSRSSAVVSDIELRRTSTTRLVFRSMLVQNPSDRAAAVKGTFIFQRKGLRDDWEDCPHGPLSGLKKDEGYSLALASAETLRLFTCLSDLYRLYQKEGIPLGETEYVRAEGALRSLSELNEQQLEGFLAANRVVGSALIARLLRWATGARDVPQLVALLEEFGPEALANLSAAVSLRALSDALQIWSEHQSDGREEFWHELLASRSFLLEQLFSWPCTIIADKAYVGGKTVQDSGGNIVDFLVRNCLTTSAALVEIKTPVTTLVGREYRRGIPNISPDLTGAVVQVVSYKASLNETYLSLRREPTEYEVFDPPCVVIAGSTSQLSSAEQKRSFELFRRQLKGVEIVTFDELFGRLARLVTILKARNTVPLEEPDEEPPF
jgi:hypothetical protein